jgi:ABC-type proline/glycine betaine transport system ATPase subunit
MIETAPPIVEFISVSYEIEKTKILADLNLQIFKGETLVLLGESGCGKTTTLKLINRLIEPTSGTVRVEGKSTLDWNRDKSAAAHRLRFAGSRTFSAFYG